MSNLLPQSKLPELISLANNKPMKPINTSLIDRNKLTACCQMNKRSFRKLGRVTHTSDQMDYIHIDRGAKVLGVAHLDVVRNMRDVNYFTLNGRRGIMSGALDDRLGVYILLHLLPKLGVECDVLLTDGEEVGKSTAQHFQLPEGKEYNWLFSFDRRGTDVVMYDYDCKHLDDKLAAVGLKSSIGSFSDISSMEHLKVKAFNVGTGYHDEHTDMCHAYFDDVISQANRFAEFWRLHHKSKMEHEPMEKWSARVGGGYRNSYGGYEFDYDRWPAADGKPASLGGVMEQCWYCGDSVSVDAAIIVDDGDMEMCLCERCAAEDPQFAEYVQDKLDEPLHYQLEDGVCCCRDMKCPASSKV